jgi:plasmid stabilization system protein ParE
MSPEISFHPREQKDLNKILECYEHEGGTSVATRFEDEFRASVERVRLNPRHFPFYWNQRLFRRYKLKTFPT